MLNSSRIMIHIVHAGKPIQADNLIALICTIILCLLIILGLIIIYFLEKKKPNDDKNNRDHGNRDDLPRNDPFSPSSGGLNPLFEQQLYEILNKQEQFV